MALSGVNCRTRQLRLKRFCCSRRKVTAFNDPFWALLRRDIRTRLRHCRANSLVDVCDAALKETSDQSRGVLTEMRVARDLRTISCTPHHSFARALLLFSSCWTCSRSHECHPQWLSRMSSRVQWSRTPLSCTGMLIRCQDKQRSARLFRSRGPTIALVFLHCDIRASLHNCCSASVMLGSRAMQLRPDLETSLLSLLRRMPNQVSWWHYPRVNQRLFSRAVPGR